MPFSFGAAGITILWLFFHGRPVEAIGLIVLNVILRAAAEQSLTAGILALFVVLLVMFSFGSSGSRIAMQRKRYRTVEELKAGERGWNIAGVIFGVLSLLIGIVSVFGLL